MQTLIIGGGLSGLAVAHALDAQGHDYVLVEARDRLGGRILTEHSKGGAFDMGPAWFWQGQPRIAALIARLGLRAFQQYADGDLLYEDERAEVHRGRGISSMQGSLRVEGGLAALIDGMAQGLPEGRLRLGAQVTQLHRTATGIRATLRGGEEIESAHVVLALPPRIAAGIACTPALPETALHALHNIPTWMAGQAKTVALYETPFWREAGLSGDASSRFGPLVEVHDASPAQGGPYALFGFIGVPARHRAEQRVLRQQITTQLTRLFGPLATTPQQILIKDWAIDPHTATAQDQRPLTAHPAYGLPDALVGLWDNRLHFAGTEVAAQFGGYLEGALEAAEDVLRRLPSQ